MFFMDALSSLRDLEKIFFFIKTIQEAVSLYNFKTWKNVKKLYTS